MPRPRSRMPCSAPAAGPSAGPHHLRAPSLSRSPAASPAMVRRSNRPPPSFDESTAFDPGEPEPQVHPRPGRRARRRPQHDRPADGERTALRAVHQRPWRVHLHDLERGTGAAPIGNDVPGAEVLECGINAPEGTAPGRNEGFRPSRQVPAGTFLAQLDDPRPDGAGRGRQLETPVHHHIRDRHQPVAGKQAPGPPPASPLPPESLRAWPPRCRNWNAAASRRRFSGG